MSLYSCSADDLEEDEVYTLATKTKRKTHEQTANHSGNLVWGNIENGTVINSKTKTITDSFWGVNPNNTDIVQLYRYDVTYEGDIWTDTIGNIVSYSAALFYYYYSVDNYFSVEIQNASRNEIYFKTIFRDVNLFDEVVHYHTLFHE